jgi:hypothetical protein
MKSIIFWDMTTCSPSSFDRRFGEAYRLHLQGRRNNLSKNQQASRWQAERTTRRHVTVPFPVSHDGSNREYATVFIAHPCQYEG